MHIGLLAYILAFHLLFGLLHINIYIFFLHPHKSKRLFFCILKNSRYIFIRGQMDKEMLLKLNKFQNKWLGGGSKIK
jgi:hypothetical protein